MQSLLRSKDRFVAFISSSKLHIFQVFGTGVLVVALLVLLSSLYSIFGRKAPITLAALDPPILENVCAGSRMLISLDVHITSPSIITYYISVMNKTEEKHLIGTQLLYRGLPYPRTGHFFQSLPWSVPDVPAGTYVRIVSALGSNGYDRPEIIETRFTVPKECEKEEEGE